VTRAVEAEQELEQRLAALLPEDTVRGLFFRSVGEALLELKGPELVAECFAESGERHFVDFFAYPAGDFLRLLRRAAGLLGEGVGDFEVALRRLGLLGTTAFLASQASYAVKLVISGGTPRRVLENLPMTYGMTTPMGGPCTVVTTGPTSGRITLGRDLLPRPFMEGSLEAYFRKGGAQGLRILGRLTGPLSSEYELAWD
jgi:uncharacterized protein (TIGR02265 family)